jgi:hypothetical protein
MSGEFTKTGTNIAASVNGFSVRVSPNGGVLYSDALGEVRIDTEWMARPSIHLLIYVGYHLVKSGEQRTVVEIERIYDSVDRALHFLGIQSVRDSQLPNQSTDPTLASGTPPAGQESRHP